MKGKVFITGGAGTLGRAIIERGKDAQFTIYSTDPAKHHKITSDFPDVVSVIGDILDFTSLSQAMAGHDIVIHAAAMKFIPEGEKYPHYTFEVNVNGSYNVIQAALQTGVKQVVGISTDKACHPVNAYGASKMMMERLFQEVALGDLVDTKFHLVRYGNVLGSRGSFIHAWKRDLEEQGHINSTDPEMTRFWLTVEDAVKLISFSLTEPSGTITIPRLKSASIKKIVEWLLEDTKIKFLGKRPGEKLHEELLTREEQPFTQQFDDYHMRLERSTVDPSYTTNIDISYSSDSAVNFTKEEFIEMIGGWDD